MSVVLERIEQAREALQGALASRDWEAIGELDINARLCIEDVLAEASVNETELRGKLEELLGVYRELIEVASGERQSIVDEMSQIRQAQNAAKVYHLFS
ncbi:flagellar protein FliT [Pseudomonas fontis]|uniref:Flagellar protein FliT n=1 Tax=Pseudomonas fontis TaxID=2942633 RepID=A0ABT5NQP4_9PSED|nr:flagellar protein FliT [Pseudomonas fontis]MDD0974563.1 flagellar protein FliT [Pseudomonas fontis]MDD0990494.1 flagellar protein FliT [Pseudomonas fontis]